MSAAQKVRLWVPGPAKSERKRQRFVKGLGNVGKRTDEPDRADWKSWVRHCAREACEEPMHGPLALWLVFQRATPASYPKRPTKRCPWPWAWMTKPDTDNLAKPTKDALTGIAWLDDAQVVEEHIAKIQGPDLPPGVLIEIDFAEPHNGWIDMPDTGGEDHD
jgi:Holliday junction resolvase RusA-like endonuclease